MNETWCSVPSSRVPCSFPSWVHHLENEGQCDRCNYDVLQGLYLEEKNTRSYYDRWMFIGKAEQGEAIWKSDMHSVGADKRDETEEHVKEKQRRIYEKAI